MWLPLIVSTRLSKLGLPNGIAMIGLITSTTSAVTTSAQSAADDERDRQLHDVALVEKVTKAFHDVLLVTRPRSSVLSERRPPKGSAS